MRIRKEGPFVQKLFDPALRLFMPRSQPSENITPIGNMIVGKVLETGFAVSRFEPGVEVYAWLPMRDIHQEHESLFQELNGLTPEQALFLDPGLFALTAVHDGGVKHSDYVFITGLGAIGLMTVQLAVLSGAKVYAEGSMENRRILAKHFGAVEVLDGASITDIGRVLKEMTGGRGVDVAIECSGKYSRLDAAIRSTSSCGKVVTVGFYPGAATDLNLGEEFFHNRITLLASNPALRWDNADRNYPLWTSARHMSAIAEILKSGKLRVEKMLYPTFKFSEVPKAVDTILNEPEKVVKVCVRIDS